MSLAKTVSQYDSTDPSNLARTSVAVPKFVSIPSTITIMDEFAQSRGDDDLFDDEIVPIEQHSSTERVTEALQQVSLETPPSQTQPVPPTTQHIPRESSPPTPRNRGRGRGGPQPFRSGARGGGSRQQTGHPGRRGGHGLAESKWSTKPAVQQPPIATTEDKEQLPPPEPDASAVTADASNSAETAPLDAPTGPAAKTRPPAVRGDRSITGGFAKPKLTEEELTAKLAAAKQKSLGLAAAHARAQADADEFAERERVASSRRRKEEGERKKMEGEREKNRARKMGSREGREWDKDKEELVGGKGYAPRTRPVDEEQQDLSMYDWHDDRGRGRGGRGGRGRGGRGRGGRGGARGAAEAVNGGQREPHVNAPEDFPALPHSAAAKNTNAPAEEKKKPPPPPTRVDSDNLAAGKSWADQMES